TRIRKSSTNSGGARSTRSRLTNNPSIMPTARASLLPADRFVARHIGPSPDETRAMLQLVGAASLDEFIDSVVPADIRLGRPLALPPGRTEREGLQALRGLAAHNQLYRPYVRAAHFHPLP